MNHHFLSFEKLHIVRSLLEAVLRGGDSILISTMILLVALSGHGPDHAGWVYGWGH